jgi:hypothetical protein
VVKEFASKFLKAENKNPNPFCGPKLIIYVSTWSTDINHTSFEDKINLENGHECIFQIFCSFASLLCPRTFSPSNFFGFHGEEDGQG